MNILVKRFPDLEERLFLIKQNILFKEGDVFAEKRGAKHDNYQPLREQQQ